VLDVAGSPTATESARSAGLDSCASPVSSTSDARRRIRCFDILLYIVTAGMIAECALILAAR
jgi:hypothetical protein